MAATSDQKSADPSSAALVLLAAASSLEAQASVLRAQAALLAQNDTAADRLLDAKQSLAQYGLGHEALRAAAERGELAVQRGARGKLLVRETELRRYIESRPYRPAPRRQKPVTSLDEWDAAADRSLKLVGGRR